MRVLRPDGQLLIANLSPVTSKYDTSVSERQAQAAGADHPLHRRLI